MALTAQEHDMDVDSRGGFCWTLFRQRPCVTHRRLTLSGLSHSLSPPCHRGDS